VISVLRIGQRQLETISVVDSAALKDATWIDLSRASVAEKDLVIDTFGEILQSNAMAGEIEATSRYFEDERAIYIQLNFLNDSSSPFRNTNAVFALKGQTLVSLHDTELVPIRLFQKRAELQPELVGSGMKVFLGILESKVDHLADVIEITFATLEELGQRVLEQPTDDLQSDLVALARLEAQNGTIRLNLMDMQRMLTSLLRSDKLGAELSRVRDVLRDVESLLSHTAFLLEEVSFLSSTMLGLIDIEQNKIVKVLSVVAVVFLPPTLVASMYGMNFHHMPELSWVFGYPLAILLMVVLGAAPYLYAKRRGWM